MKRCFKCFQVKDLSSFYVHSKMADGHLNKCKECTKKDVHARRHGHGREKVLEYDRARYKEQPHRRISAANNAREWAIKHPNRRAAQIILRNAIRGGKIFAMPCFICGEKAEAHHPDYDRPLDVVWLCPSHHKQAHSLSRQ